MIDVHEIDRAITRLESGDTTYSSCAKLADLYAVREHMVSPGYETAASYSAKPSDVVGEYGNSDFLLAISGKDGCSAWGVMDDLMDTLRVVNPKVYARVLKKINSI